MYFSGRCLSLWMKLIIYSHMGERWIRYKHFPPSTLGYSVCNLKKKNLVVKIICTFWCWRKEWIVWAERAHLHFLHHLFAEWADFGWDGDGHVLSAAVLTADTVERARPVLNATVIQIRLRNEQRNKLRAVSSIVHWKILTLTYMSDDIIKPYNPRNISNSPRI